MTYPRTVYQLANQVRFFAKHISECTSEDMEEICHRGISQCNEELYNQLHEHLEKIVDRLGVALVQARYLHKESK